MHEIKLQGFLWTNEGGAWVLRHPEFGWCGEVRDCSGTIYATCSPPDASELTITTPNMEQGRLCVEDKLLAWFKRGVQIYDNRVTLNEKLALLETNHDAHSTIPCII